MRFSLALQIWTEVFKLNVVQIKNNKTEIDTNIFLDDRGEPVGHFTVATLRMYWQWPKTLLDYVEENPKMGTIEEVIMYKARNRVKLLNQSPSLN